MRWAADDRMNEVEGTFDEVDWLPVSQWLLEEWRRAQVQARAAKALERGPEVRRPAADVDAPSEEAMVTGLFNIAQAGNVASESLRAFTAEEMQNMMAKA